MPAGNMSYAHAGLRLQIAEHEIETDATDEIYFSREIIEDLEV